jgi:Acetyltransferase (GNAT) family
MLQARLASSNEVENRFREVFGTSPPSDGFIALVENDGKLVGFGCLQQVWHIEPMWIDPRWRGRGAFQRLLRLLVSRIPKDVNMVLCFTEEERMVRVFGKMGGQFMSRWKVFRWWRRGAYHE